jgi:hypothetical protein
MRFANWKIIQYKISRWRKEKKEETKVTGSRRGAWNRDLLEACT